MFLLIFLVTDFRFLWVLFIQFKHFLKLFQNFTRITNKTCVYCPQYGMVLLTHRSKLNTFRCCVSISNNIFIMKYWELFCLNYNSVSVNLPLNAQKLLTEVKLCHGFFMPNKVERVYYSKQFIQVNVNFTLINNFS